MTLALAVAATSATTEVACETAEETIDAVDSPSTFISRGLPYEDGAEVSEVERRAREAEGELRRSTKAKVTAVQPRPGDAMKPGLARVAGAWPSVSPLGVFGAFGRRKADDEGQDSSKCWSRRGRQARKAPPCRWWPRRTEGRTGPCSHSTKRYLPSVAS